MTPPAQKTKAATAETVARGLRGVMEQPGRGQGGDGRLPGPTEVSLFDPKDGIKLEAENKLCNKNITHFYTV